MVDKTPKDPTETTPEEPGATEVAKPATRATHPFDLFGLADLFGRWPALFSREWTELEPELMGTAMKVEEHIDDGTLVVRGEIPGVDPESDIEITVDDGKLSISAHREQRTESTEHGYRSEFRYGSYRRTLTLPAGARADEIAASYEDGILEVRVPIDEETGGRTRIPISRSR